MNSYVTSTASCRHISLFRAGFGTYTWLEVPYLIIAQVTKMQCAGTTLQLWKMLLQYSNSWKWRFLFLHYSYSYNDWHKAMHYLLRAYWGFHMYRKDIKHTGSHEMQQYSGSLHLPLLGSSSLSTRLEDLQFYCRTTQNKPTKQSKNPPLSWTLSRRIPEQLSTRPENIPERNETWLQEKKNPGRKQIRLTCSKKS